MLEDLKLGPRYDGFLFLAEAARNPPVLRPHRHLELELNLVVRGTITYVHDGRRFSFHAGTLLWLFPAQEHQLVDRTGDAQYYVAVFKPTLIRQACRGATYIDLKRRQPDVDGVLHAEPAPADFDLIRRTMDALVEDGLDPDLLNREAGFGVGSDFHFEHGDPDWLNAGLRHLLLLCWRHQRGRGGKARPVNLHPAVRRALSVLGEEEWSAPLESLAGRCGVSAAYLSRVFARQVGISLTRYRNSARLARFWEHHRRAGGGTNVTEAMYAAGFGSYAQFYKVFKDAYGRGPRRHLLAEKQRDRTGAYE